VLTVNEIVFHYPRSSFGLRIDHFACRAGSATAIVGPSGCGKTTFLNLAAGILQPQEGRIQLDGTVISKLGASASATHRLSRIGLIFQEFELVEHLTVRENILLPRLLGLQTDPDALEKRAHTLAEETGIGPYWNTRPANLSHGERQRVAICRALSINPRIVLADEPTGNLDPTNKRMVLDLMVNFAKVANRTLVVATHDLALLEAFDEVVQFENLNQFAPDHS
jgi:putative ABC transport system ATP-binding protein